MKNRDFNSFWELLEKTNVDIKNLVDMDKVIKNVELIEVYLNSLNYIIANNYDTLVKKIKILYKQNHECFQVIPILAALRISKDNYYIFNNKQKNATNLISCEQDVIDFLNQTKLTNLILSGKIKNFVDYVFGIEVGLDSNARKNRNGKQENDLYQEIKDIFKKYDYIDVEKQKTININDLKNQKESLNKNLLEKCFDIVIKNNLTNENFYLETSYYNAHGSKINETAKSFKLLNDEINNCDNQKNHFIWIVDGNGIKSIKKTLEIFYQDDYIYNKKQFFDNVKELVLDTNTNK